MTRDQAAIYLALAITAKTTAEYERWREKFAATRVPLSEDDPLVQHYVQVYLTETTEGREVRRG
jgi:hypothetical protein